MLPNAALNGVAPAHWIAFTWVTKILQRSAVRQVCQIRTIIDDALQIISHAESNTALDNDCTATFTAAPSCADSSWSLWNATTDISNKAEYFCCLQGQVGLPNGYCVDNANAATAGSTAVLVSFFTSLNPSPFSTQSNAYHLRISSPLVPAPCKVKAAYRAPLLLAHLGLARLRHFRRWKRQLLLSQVPFSNPYPLAHLLLLQHILLFHRIMVKAIWMTCKSAMVFKEGTILFKNI